MKRPKIINKNPSVTFEAARPRIPIKNNTVETNKKHKLNKAKCREKQNGEVD